ncbi:MAG: lipoprotein [Steroidobacteraceae bacterium]
MRFLACAALILPLLAACGQKGPLYQPDEGIEVSPTAPATTPDAAPAATSTTDGAASTPVTPASPDRSEEARKRIPDAPSPATTR